MKTILRVSIFAITALAFAACQPVSNTNSNTNGNTNANVAAKAAAPSADSLMALETKAWEAYKNKDGKYFEGYVAERVISGNGEAPKSKAEVVKMITDHKDELKSFSIADPHVTPVGTDAVVLTYKATVDGTENGKPIPSPAMASSVFVRTGADWKAVYHNEVPITEAPKPGADSNKSANANTDKKMPPPPPSKDATMNSNSTAKAGNANSNSNTNSSATSTNDAALTDALMALEKKGWEGWKAKDAKALDAITAKDIALINGAGMATFGKDAVMKMWTTDNPCNVSSVSVSDGKAEMITKDAAILVAKGTAVGTCGDMKLEPLWNTSVFVKEGDAWKVVYVFESPLRKM